MQNSAGDSSPKHLPIDPVSPSPTQDTIQGEGSHGEGGEGRIKNGENTETPSQKLKLDSDKGSGDGETVSLEALAKEDTVENPMVEVGQKRKACNIPIWKSMSPNRRYHQYVNTPPISPPTGQQLNDQLVPQEDGGEGNEKVKGNEGSSIRGLIQGFHLNQQIEGMENSPNPVEVKPFVVEEMEVEPYAAKNYEVEPSAVEKNEVKPCAMEKNKVDPCGRENNEVKPSDVEKKEVEPFAEVNPSAIEKDEVEHYAKKKNEEYYPTEKHEMQSSATNKTEMGSSLTVESGFPNARDFEFDLNELPPEENENST